MIVCEDCGEVHEYEYGDRVRLVQNHMLTGQVIDEQGWGGKYHVRLGATVSAIWFDACELEPDPDFVEPAATKTPPSGGDSPDDNIINLAAVRAKGGVH